MTDSRAIPGARGGRGETDVSRAIQDALKAVGIWCIRVQAGRHRVKGGYLHCAEAGTPDLLVLSPALGWLEVKRDEKEKPRASQELWHAKAKSEGIRVAIVSSPREAVETVLGWARGRGAEMGVGA